MLLASCGTEIKFHKWPSGDYYGSYQIPEAGFSIPSLSWCNEGELLVTTVPSLGPPIVISVENSEIQTYQLVDIPQIQAAAFSSAIQKNIAFGTEGGHVLIYDIDQKCIVERLPSLPSAIKHLQYGAQDTTLAAGCKNGQICLYNSKNNVSATFYVPNSNSLSAMACHSKLPYLLAAASTEGIVVVWDTSTGNVEFLDKSHNGSTTDVTFSSSNVLASVGLDERFIGYDLRSRECIFCCKTNEQLSAVEFMPAGTQLAVGTTDGKLFCYDTRSINHPLHTIVAHHPKPVGRIAFQNVSYIEDPMQNEICEVETINKRSKSNITTVVYNKAPFQQTSATSLSQQPSTINTIVPDTNSNLLQPNSQDILAYLENLHYNNPTENRGDAVSHGIDCFNQNQSKTTPQESGTRTPANILNRSPFTNNRGLPNKPLAEEDVDPVDVAKNDTINNWIKKIQLNSSSYMTNVTVLMDQDEDILKLRRELQDVTKEAIEQLTEIINREFLKVRMAVSRGFVQMECKMNARWAELNHALMKTRGYMCEDIQELVNARDIKENSVIQFPSIRLSTRSFSKP